MVDGDSFQRYWLTSHRPDGAGRRCPANDGLDHLAPIQSGRAKDRGSTRTSANKRWKDLISGAASKVAPPWQDRLRKWLGGNESPQRLQKNSSRGRARPQGLKSLRENCSLRTQSLSPSENSVLFCGIFFIPSCGRGQPEVANRGAMIPLKPKDGLNGAPSICCQ
jgi:hypothetical protein